MENPSSIGMSPEPSVFDEIAIEMGVSAAFVEKDWFSVQVLKAIAGHENGGFHAIFSGGTSLSKGYGLIQRFSEDLDFRCLARQSGSGNQAKIRRRVFRKSLLDVIDNVDCLTLDKSQVAVASNYLKFDLDYPQSHGNNTALRAGLQVEFSFTPPQLEVQSRRVQSFVSRLSGWEPEVEIACLSPVETAADKLSALVWRVLSRDRTSLYDDPTMIRHLHDIAALAPVIREDKGLFIETAAVSFEMDQRTTNRNTQKSLSASIQATAELLKDDEEYRSEYGNFVDAMSYAADDENMDFDSAMLVLNRIGSWFK